MRSGATAYSFSLCLMHDVGPKNLQLFGIMLSSLFRRMMWVRKVCNFSASCSRLHSDA
ncbi:hypothetical protein MPC4_70031 [Methylocella tundrae]|uniref:Uncharacterized protein n=1 Tax=Methylocella tundrae TaxID=227605 RepID=A0A8B6MB54_METTU|nr:hypothetical protein MPC4_70031 [Methylocella tundrae]